MKRCVAVLHGLVAISVAVLFAGCGPHPNDAPPATVRVERGPLQVWATYTGRIEARRVHTLRSQLGGQATLVELAPDGANVRAGEVIARFDPTRVEREIVRLEAAYAAARSEYDMLREADGPLKIADLERQCADARARADEEAALLADSRQLAAEGLLSERDLRQQETRAAQAAARASQLDQQLRLTREFLLPLNLEQARARLSAAERELELARQERRACDVIAPADGILGHLPTHIGGEFRTARVGDMLHLNQAFLILPDLSQLIVIITVPEAELGRIPVEAEAVVTPIAFPELSLSAHVENVGATAQSIAGKPSWQRFFPASVALRQGDPRLRVGMSATVRILSYANERALLVPRAAVQWQGGQARVRVRKANGAVDDRPIAVGRANATRFEVLDGLAEGEEVVVE